VQTLFDSVAFNQSCQSPAITLQMSCQNSRVNRVLNHLTPTSTPNAFSGSSSSTTLSATSAAAKRFKFTVDSDILTSEQREFYEINGYLLIRGLLSEDDIKLYIETFRQLANGKRPKPATMLLMKDVVLAKSGAKVEGEQYITKIQDWCEVEELFHFCQHPNILKYVRGIVGDDLRAMHTMLINKPTDLGKGSSRHPPHQDLWYFPFRAPEHIVCAWSALQHIDTENGCLFVLPGSHLQPLFRHSYPDDGIVNKAYHGIQSMSRESDLSNHKFVQCIMEPGDTLFFHPLLIHGSGRNNSPNFRKAISCHYASTSLCKYIDVDGTMQEDIANEVVSMAKLKGTDVKYSDLWRLKSRHVAGKMGNLA
jgi:phytanoyl-CoA hydroxylase